ncbi:MAG: hypothetical protein ACLQJ7_08250 [Syntrophobacteraceae bacterium]
MAKWSPKNRYRTTICVLLPNPELKAKAESYGAEVICFNRPRPSILKLHRFISYYYRNVRDIVSLCRREHVDVIHCHLSEAEFVGIVAISATENPSRPFPLRWKVSPPSALFKEDRIIKNEQMTSTTVGNRFTR